MNSKMSFESIYLSEMVNIRYSINNSMTHELHYFEYNEMNKINI